MDTSLIQFAKIVLVVAVVYILVKKLSGESFDGLAYGPWNAAAGTTVTPNVAGVPPMPVSSDLLPKAPAGNNWKDFVQAADLIKTSFLDPTALTGVNTVQGTLKNAVWDIRGAEPVQRQPNLSLWNQSTIEGDRPRAANVFCMGRTG